MNEEILKNETLSVQFEKLGLDYTGITLTTQDIDLMTIMNAQTIDELKVIVEKTPLLWTAQNWDMSSYTNIEEAKNAVFKEYQNNLITKVDSIIKPELIVQSKIPYLKEKLGLTDKQINNLIDIYKKSKKEDLLKNMSASFNEELIDSILTTLKEYQPLERSGMSYVEPKTIVNLYNLLTKVDETTKKKIINSITLDSVVKFGSIVKDNGKYDFREFDKALDFCIKLNIPVRLNALIFYMDCPDRIFNLEPNEDNKKIAKQALKEYIEKVMEHIANYEKDNDKIVRSIDVMNELLNRFDSGSGYGLRNDITGSEMGEDNAKSGWLKFLNVDDMCDIISSVKSPESGIDFMYNDDNLVDSKKLDALLNQNGLLRKLHKRIITDSNGDVKEKSVIDSIGTQLHLDNDVSVKDIENMFRRLHELGLPIEITEFDLAMTKGVKGLKDTTIEILRQKKLYEIYTCIEKLKAEGIDIRGFTAWSKTDSQSFRNTLRLIDLAGKLQYDIDQLIREKNKEINELIEAKKKEEKTDKEIEEFVKIKERELGELIAQKQSEREKTLRSEYKKTVHSGYFSEEINPKFIKSLINNEYRSFNFHTHTFRCGHGNINATDEDYVKAAREAGITVIGFSDHIPYAKYEFPDRSIKMNFDDVEGYFKKIEELQKNNPDIKILKSFEAEYDPANIVHLIQMREKCDYMILGQHFIRDGINTPNLNINDSSKYKNYPLIYAESVCKAMDTGLFDILAHPDSFMEEIRHIKGEENIRDFLENGKKAARMICDKAAELSIPIELNLGGLDRYKGVPDEQFWQIVAEKQQEYPNLQVICGTDAHDPDKLKTMAIDQIAAMEQIGNPKLRFVSKNYDPAVRPEVLKTLLAETKQHQIPYDIYVYTQVINSVINDEQNKDKNIYDIYELVDKKINSLVERTNNYAESRAKKLDETEKIFVADAKEEGLKPGDREFEMMIKERAVNRDRIIDAYECAFVMDAKNSRFRWGKKIINDTYNDLMSLKSAELLSSLGESEKEFIKNAGNLNPSSTEFKTLLSQSSVDQNAVMSYYSNLSATMKKDFEKATGRRMFENEQLEIAQNNNVLKQIQQTPEKKEEVKTLKMKSKSPSMGSSYGLANSSLIAILLIIICLMIVIIYLIATM